MSHAKKLIESLTAAEPAKPRQPWEPAWAAAPGFYAVETTTPVPLHDGTYHGLRYGYTLEVDGKLFPTTQGTRCTREGAGEPKEVTVRGGKAEMRL